VFPSPAAKDLAPATLRAKVASALKALAAEGGSSMHPVRALITADPPSIDANEITDKGYLNQRAVLERRAALVEKLHAKQPGADVITAAG
jgi:feruloyl-CoA synthase